MSKCDFCEYSYPDENGVLRCTKNFCFLDQDEINEILRLLKGRR